jgi:hypothetical protein
MCAPQYASPSRAGRRALPAPQSLPDHQQSAAAGLSTTSVLWIAASDFSTDAFNSALIVNNEVSATSCNAISACPATDERLNKTNKKRSPIAS